MKKKWIKIIVAAVVVIALGGGSVLGYKYFVKPSASASAITYRAVKVQKGNIDVSITASGTITCGSQYDIESISSGSVDKLPIKEGDTVKKGDLLAKINDTAADDSVKQSANNLTQKNLELAKLNESTSTLYYKSPTGGRIKSLIVSPGDDISNLKAVGPLAYISTDGQMKLSVNVPSGSSVKSLVSENEAVDVVVNGVKVKGTVTSTSVNEDTNLEKTIENARTTLNQKKLDLDKLNKSLDSLYVKAPIQGRVKSIIPSPGDSVDNLKVLGPMAIISTDGQMKLTLNVQPSYDFSTYVSVGEVVSVNANGMMVQGTVSSTTVALSTNSEKGPVTTSGTIVIMAPDTLPANTTASVYRMYGTYNALGSGTLQINNPVPIQGTSGVISDVYVSENSYVNKGDNLFKYNADDIQQNIESKKLEITQAQNDLNNALNNVKNDPMDLSSLGNESATTSGTVQVLIPRDDFPIGATATVQKEDNNGTVIGTGTLALNNAISIQGTSGTISDLYVSENSVVNKGDNLFKLNGTDLENSITSKNIDIQQAQEDLANKQLTLQKNNLTSPIDGIVAALNYNVGDTVPANKAVATILDPSQMRTIVSVDELDIAKIKLGMKATINLDAIPDKAFDGQVIKIATLGKTTNGVTTYDVTVSIDNPENIKVGMTSNVKIVTQSKQDILMVPVAAAQGRGSNRTIILAKGLLNQSSTSGNRSAGYNNSNNSNTNTKGNSAATGNATTRGNNTRNANAGGGNFSRNSNAGGNSNANFAQNQNIKIDSSKTETLRNNTIRVNTGIANEEYIEVLDGVNEGDQVLIPILGSSFQSQRTTNPFSTNQGGFMGGGFQGNTQRVSGGNNQGR